ncbi:hydantoinase/oxoprolinase family protein [Fuchsiella alkaliacetigena]|uniref:hydantoinase/oxoprolinase family protein n=1 Tax=Fuchsiella alkaliacetigena TaxID=957042 RepID=UPI00200A5A26|nr:hydantoinase/oxoprolinase family protein [Fuchsiella alkaliacetigena]MCK8823726.1 hydantoinase/oxoprolinase family protein [Fuchsiella alkaliacetigena]
MQTALGIDTGGTYTDGVVIDIDEGRLLSKAKAFTTRQDLSLGIKECIDNLAEVDYQQIKLVSLSTTLATNAIVEGQGCEVGLILIGFEAEEELPTEHIAEIKGGHDIKGSIKEELDCSEVKEIVAQLVEKVDAFAVSGYLSVRNPEHEERVKEIIKELSDYPVVCAHELTSSLGVYERTATAVLNARLIPIIAELVEAVEESMAARGITAPLMIVKGDGSLVSKEVALEKPIETILSGPASSLVGATYLTDLEDAVVVDMGGTTTDVALLKQGSPSLNEAGAKVGGWLTRVQAIDMETIGIGGDSRIQVSKKGALEIGPQRVFPLSWAGDKYSHLLAELREVKQAEYFPVNSQPSDILFFIKESYRVDLTRTEKEILKVIKEQPHTLYRLGQILDKDPNLLPWERLVNVAAVHRAGLTPSDILHFLGEMECWQCEMAELGVEIAAQRHRSENKEFINEVQERIYYRLALVILQSLLSAQGIELESVTDSEVEFLLTEILKKPASTEKELINFFVELELPIVAIGAPVKAYFPTVAQRLNTDLEIPPHAAVANAVGTITGQIVERVKILIKPGQRSGYLLHAPWIKENFAHLEEAVSYAEKKGVEYVKTKARRSGAVDLEVSVEHEDVYSSLSAGQGKEDMYLESRVEIVAMGRPALN